MLEIFLALVAGLLSFVIWTRWNGIKLRSKMGLSGPKANLFLGNIIEFGSRENTELTLLDWKKKYGSTYGYFIGPLYFVVIHDLEMIKEVLVKQFSGFTDRMVMLMNGNGLKDSVISLHADSWKPMRNALSPSFTANKLKKMQQIMWQKTEVFINKCGRNTGKPFDIYDAFQALTLDVIGKCAFAIDCDCQENPADPFLLNVQKFFRYADFTTSKLFMLAILFPELDTFWSYLNRSSRMGEAEKVILDGLTSVYNERKRNYKTFKSVDIMQLLLQQRDNEVDDPTEDSTEVEWVEDENLGKRRHLKLKDTDILSNSYVFLLAGYETTSTALGFTAWLMAKYPEAQKKLQAEIDEFCLESSDINYDTLHKMPYLDAVFKESLRFYPPVVNFVARTCIEECTVHGVKFLPGVQVLVPVYLIHHDPEIWPDPDNFIPERFLGNPDIHTMAWLPFGGGPRNCIGLRFAELEYKICLTKLLKNFSIDKGPQFQDPLKTKSTNALLRPTEGVSVLLSKRQ